MSWLSSSKGEGTLGVDCVEVATVCGDVAPGVDLLECKGQVGFAQGASFGSMRFLVDDDLRARRLVELLPECAGASRPFSLPYPAGRHMPLRVRALIDYLTAHLKPERAPGPAS